MLFFYCLVVLNLAKCKYWSRIKFWSAAVLKPEELEDYKWIIARFFLGKFSVLQS